MNHQLTLFGLPAQVATTSLHCQRWDDQRRQKWTLAAPGERFDARHYEVHRIDRPTARGFVQARHYSRSHVACRQSFGLYRRSQLVGVASYCVSTEQSLRLAFPELVPGAESLELGRFVVADAEPGNVETFFDARCREYLLAAGVHAVLAFADPVPRIDRAGTVLFPGHVGYIYQGGGYLQAGRSARRTQWQLPDGTYLNGITMQKIRRQRPGHEAAERRLVEDYGARPRRAGEDPAAWLRDGVRDNRAVGITLVRHGGCHRYLKPLGNRRQAAHVKINRRLRPSWNGLDKHAVLPAGPYPKRPDSPGTNARLIRRALAER